MSAATFGEAMLKSQLGAGSRLPTKGTVCITVKNSDKPRAVAVARDLHSARLRSWSQRAAPLPRSPTPACRCAPSTRSRTVGRTSSTWSRASEIQLVFTTVDETRTAIADSRHIRQAALAHRVTYYTSMAGCEAAVEGMKHRDDLSVVSLQELHAELH